MTRKAEKNRDQSRTSFCIRQRSQPTQRRFEMRRLLVQLFVAALFVACGGGGGGHSPTEPQVIQVSGTWRGLWLTSGISVASVLSLSQNGSDLTGTISILNSTFNVKGTAGTSSLTWAAVGGGCGSLVGSGSAASQSPTQLAGSITLDTRGCSNPDFFDGPNQWIKGNASTANGPGTGQGRIGDLARSLRESRK
jgi:hypothetical protein